MSQVLSEPRDWYPARPVPGWPQPMGSILDGFRFRVSGLGFIYIYVYEDSIISLVVEVYKKNRVGT